MTHLKTLLSVALIVASATGALADEISAPPLNPETAAALAVEASASLVQLQRKLDDAADALGWGPYRDDLSLSIDGSLAGEDLSALTSKGSSTLAASVAVLPQLTVTGRIVGQIQEPEPPQGLEPITGSVGLTFKPLADAGGNERDRIAFERARVALEAEARKTAYTAVERLFEAVAAQADLSLAAAEVALATETLAATEALAERDRATDDELEGATDALRAARQSRERLALAADRAVWNLAHSLGLEPDAVTVPDWDDLALAEAIDDIRVARPDLAPEALAGEKQTVHTAALDLESASVELATTRRFTPELSAEAKVTLPGPTYSLGLGFTVTPDDWDGSAKREADEDARFAEAALAAARTSAEYDARSALLELDIALEELGAKRHDLALAEQSLAEARFRFDRGDVTRVVVARAELVVGKAAAAVETARAAVVERWYGIDLAQF